MYRIKTLNKISSVGLSQLDKSRFVVDNEVENEDGILVRSADMHGYEFPDALRAIAHPGDIVLTVGAGDVYKIGERLVKDEK